MTVRIIAAANGKKYVFFILILFLLLGLLMNSLINWQEAVFPVDLLSRFTRQKFEEIMCGSWMRRSLHAAGRTGDIHVLVVRNRHHVHRVTYHFLEVGLGNTIRDLHQTPYS